uniref:PAP2_C domain-containing protein n=1 Tax=Panagrellus redivivus TaxID=6233 RepID=A0A7E4V124_PANRE
MLQMAEPRPLPVTANRDMKDLLPTTSKDVPSSPKRYEVDRFKVVYALATVGIGWFLNEVVLAYIHDHVPRSIAPLPDIFFRYFPEIPEAIVIVEYIMLFMVTNALIVIVCHQHRWIVGRRVMFCVGLSYIFRSMCILLVQVPVPSVNTYCAPQSADGGFGVVMDRVVKIFWSAGIEQLRPRILCGDLIVSGHTLTLFISMMTFRHYTPRRMTYLGYFYNFLAFVALFCILLARKHYSIDVVLGYFVSTRIFWEYHSLAYSFHQGDMDRNALSQAIWAPFVSFFESDAPPPHLWLNALEWPSSCPSRVRRYLSM